MDELIDSVEEWTGKKIDGTEKEVNRSRDDVEMEQRDRLKKDKASKDLLHDKQQTVFPEELSLESTSTRHQTQRSNSAFEENQLQVSSKPSLSFVALIAKAILSSASKKLNLSSIYRYIEEHFLYFKTTHKGWRNSIRHNLSLNDCFVKLGRCEDGKGHYWGIHPAHVADFHRGDFRQHRKANRRRQLRVHSMTEACSWMAQCSLLEYWSSGAAAIGVKRMEMEASKVQIQGSDGIFSILGYE
ncbi:hypothetical protein AOLI_G00058280 [Acnodon oligacanthus]